MAHNMSMCNSSPSRTEQCSPFQQIFSPYYVLATVYIKLDKIVKGDGGLFPSRDYSVLIPGKTYNP